jgi:DNA-binding NarL/FixJ family response regulator
MGSLKVVLADSNNLIRIGLSSLLKNRLAEVEIIEAASSAILKKILADFTPDVILIDYTAKEFAIDTMPQCIAINPDVKFVAITYEQMGTTIINAIKSGVMSYIKKDCDVEEIVDAVSETAKGNKFFCGQILETIRAESIEVEEIKYEPLSCEPISLTEREVEVMQHIAEGMTNNQIADKLFLSNHTITTHRKNIMAKLGVNNTAGIVMYAVKSNFVSANKFLFSGSNN